MIIIPCSKESITHLSLNLGFEKLKKNQIIVFSLEVELWEKKSLKNNEISRLLSPAINVQELERLE